MEQLLRHEAVGPRWPTRGRSLWRGAQGTYGLLMGAAMGSATRVAASVDDGCYSGMLPTVLWVIVAVTAAALVGTGLRMAVRSKRNLPVYLGGAAAGFLVAVVLDPASASDLKTTLVARCAEAAQIGL